MASYRDATVKDLERLKEKIVAQNNAVKEVSVACKRGKSRCS